MRAAWQATSYNFDTMDFDMSTVAIDKVVASNLTFKYYVPCDLRCFESSL